MDGQVNKWKNFVFLAFFRHSEYSLHFHLQMQMKQLAIYYIASITEFIDFIFRGFSYWGVRGRGEVPTINLTNLYSIFFLSVLHENKALQNFHKSGQHPIAGCMKGLENDLQRLIPPSKKLFFCYNPPPPPAVINVVRFLF